MPGAARKPLKYINDSVEYRQHQVDGIRDLATRGSFILGDDMGLGKSLQALTVAAIDFERDWAKRVLIVSPATLKWNWQDEIDKFTTFTRHVLDGTPAKRLKQMQEFMDQETHILIVNYEQVVAHYKEFIDMKFDIVIFDEAHALKSNKSKRTKAAVLLCRTVARRFFLTGSPLLNQVNELWPILHMIDPTEYPNYWRFVSRYAVFGGFKNKSIVGVKNAPELASRVQGVMLRRMKKDVLDLPDKDHIVIKLDLTAQQRKLYKEAKEEMKLTLPSNPTPMEMENAMVKFLRLKQICGTTYAIDPSLGDFSSKLDRLEEQADELIGAGKHLVVFTQFRGVLACAEMRLQNHGLQTFTLHGDVDMRLRTEVVRQWSDAKPGVIIAMLQVAGVGLNMVKASDAIFLDKLFVPKLNEQAEDRLHRIGADATQPVTIYEYICRNTVEARVEQILKTKRKVFDTLVEDTSWKKALIEAMFDDEDEY